MCVKTGTMSTVTAEGNISFLHDYDRHYIITNNILWKYTLPLLNVLPLMFLQTIKVKKNYLYSTVENARPELEAMIREQKSTSQTPLLILSCIKDNSKHRLPAADIVSMLKLSAVSQPWMVSIGRL